MTASMTAYGREQVCASWGEAICEMRTLNHRYLEIAIRLPDHFRPLEQLIREKITGRLKRGKVDCTIHCKGAVHESNALAINDVLAHQIIAAAESIMQKTRAATYINPLDILRWPGIISEDKLDLDNISADVSVLLDKTLDSIIQTRNREGEKIKSVIEKRCESVQQKIAAIQDQLPKVKKAQRERLLGQINKLQVELDQDKIEQEMLLLARKQDIAEELDRLTVHIEEVTRVLAGSGPSGQRIDFLIQEMRREANTLGAKSTDADITKIAVDIKILIEQMREQIQNVE